MTITTMTPVESSQISALGHDPVSQTLKVRFKNGASYLYQHVTREIYEAILTAESVGKAFIAHVKSQPSKHPFEKEAA